MGSADDSEGTPENDSTPEEVGDEHKVSESLLGRFSKGGLSAPAIDLSKKDFKEDCLAMLLMNC